MKDKHKNMFNFVNNKYEILNFTYCIGKML